MKCCFSLLLLLITIPLLHSSAKAQSTSYADVMVIINDSSWQSREIGNYFASRRDIPSWHVCHIAIDSSESIDSLGFQRLKWQMETWMRSRNLTDSINYIVTTKGCPLRVWTALQDNEVTGPYSGQASFEDCVALMNGADSVYILTPKYVRRQSRYFGANYPFQRNSSSMPMYLVTRLDAYSVSQAEALIRAAESTVNPTQGLWQFDMDPSKNGNPGLAALNTYMIDADSILRARGLSTELDNTLTYQHNRSNVLAYASWGSNDAYSGGGNSARPQNSWVNGSVAETYVSTSGRSFAPGAGYGQSLIADIIAEGASAAKGYTDEPYATSMAHIDILVDLYSRGYTMAESFYAASRWAAWRQVIIGDPKMRLYMPVIAVVGPRTFCEGDTSVVLTAPAGYARQVWSTGDTTRTITVRTSGNYSVTMYGTSGYTVTSPAVSVTVHPRPLARITPAGTSAICEGDSVTLRADSGYAAYRWSTGDTTRSITIRTAGMYAVTTVSQFGCSRTSDSVAVIVRPRPQPVITALGPATLCSGDSVILDAGAGYTSYRWTTGDSARKITVRTSGIYRVTVTNQFGCARQSEAATITVHPRPAPKIVVRGNKDICRGEASVLESDSTYAHYLWSTGDTTRSITVRETGNYSLLATSKQGCAAQSDIVRIEVHELPNASIAGPETVCLNSTATYAVADEENVSYNWGVSGAGGEITGGEFTHAIQVRWKSAGAGKVELRAINNSSGCQTTTSIGVDVGNALVPVIRTSRSPRLCPGGSIELAADSGYANYKWSTGATTRAITVNTPGSYTVTVSDAEGCSGTSQPLMVTVNTPPQPVITAPDGLEACDGRSVVLDAGMGYRSYRWSGGERTRRITVTVPGSYSVTVEDSAGCSGTSLPATVAIHSVPVPVIAGPDAVCSNSTATYSLETAAYQSYEWEVTNGTITSGMGSASIIVQWPAIGSGTVRLRATSSDGCTSEAEPYVVTIGTSLHPAITPSGAVTVCQGDSLRLTAPAGYASYLWSNGATTRSITVHLAGTYWVRVADAGGCQGTSDPVLVSLRMPPAPVISPSGTVSLCNGDSVRLEVAPDYASYEWATGEKGRSIVVHNTGMYTVAVYDSNGCYGLSKPVHVIVHDPPHTPVIEVQQDTLISSVASGYQWYRDNEILAGATGRTYVAEHAGTYAVRTVDSNGCSAISELYDFTLPEPPAPAATVALPTLTARSGDHIVIPIDLIASRDLDRIGRHTFNATVRLNASILIPVDSVSTGVVIDGERIITLSGVRAPGMTEGTLAHLQFVADNDVVDSTLLLFDSFEWTGDSVQTTLINGVVRLYRDTTGSLFLSLGPVTPHPVSSSVEILYTLIEEGHTQLMLEDVNGRHVATLLDSRMEPGRHRLRFDVGGLPSGLYFLTLQTPTGRQVRGMVVAR